MPPSPIEPAAGSPSPAEQEVLALVARAEAHLAASRFDQAVHAASQAAALRVRLDVSLPTLARMFEAQGDLQAALDIYAQALDAAPKDAEVSGAMGRLALRMGKPIVAEQALARRLEREPADIEAIAGVARAQAGQRAYDRAQATLTAALQADPAQALLWRTLADILAVQGRQAEAIVFYEEALRLDGSSWAALDGIADAILLASGDDARALDASAAALEHAPAETRPEIVANHARRLLAAGRLAEGWEAFARKVWPGEDSSVTVKLAAPRLAPDAPVEGRLLLIGEEDVASELLLAQAVPRLIADGVAPILAVHPSWTALAQRSFPQAAVVTLRERMERGRRWLTAELDSPHVHGGELVGAWAPLRALPGLYASASGTPADATPYLTPDAARVGHWRERLAALPAGPKAGLVWRGPEAATQPWAAPPLGALAAALKTPGVTLIGIQAQDVQGELVWIRETFGMDVLEPPPDLRPSDLDDLAALTLALDVVVGLPDTPTILAAACGAETWILSPARHWARLGAPTYPWFPKARVMAAEGPGDWNRALGELNAALTALAAQSA